MKSRFESARYLKSYRVIALIAFKFLFPNTSKAMEINYVVKKSDTMTTILYRLGEKKIYGANGSLIRNLALNPSIKANGDLIFPKMIIKLSINEQASRKRTSRSKPKSSLVSGDLATIQKITQEQPFEMNIQRLAQHTLNIFSKYSFFRVDSDSKVNGSSAVLLSEPSLGLDLGLEQTWNDKFSTGLLASYQNVNFNHASKGTIAKGSSQSVSGINFHSSYLIPGKIFVFAGGGYSNQLVAKSLSSGVATVNSIGQFSGGVGARRNIFNYRTFEVGVSGEYKKFFDSRLGNVLVRDSNAYQLGINLKKSLGRFNFLAELSYFFLSTDTTTTRQRVKNFNSVLGLSWDFFE